MKIVIAYPPLEGPGSPMLTQNRQFQWYNVPSFIFPVVPAYAATMLKQAGHDVLWLDGITRGLTLEQFEKELVDFDPHLVALETKTPVVRQHWKMIDRWQEIIPRARTLLMGDHVTARPIESLRHSKVDFVLTGGDYDFLLLSLADFMERGGRLEPGFFCRSGRATYSTGGFKLNHNLAELPLIDRELTEARRYGEKWKKRTPFMYTMVGRDCPWGRCRFCSWTTLFPHFRCRSPESLLDELEYMVADHGVREVFDDSGTFPGGGWLERFCDGMIERGLSKEILFSCNMRFDYLRDPEVPRMMKRAGFRKIKSGLESANQKTLDLISKGITVEDIVTGCRNAANAGIDVHLTVMVGYPWETRDDARRTLDLAHKLMSEGAAEMLQATVLVPYPGTPLHTWCESRAMFRHDPYDYEKYDMRHSVIETPGMTEDEVLEMCEGVYRSFLGPRYIWQRLKRVRSLRDLRYILRGAKAVVGHLHDFRSKRREVA